MPVVAGTQARRYVQEKREFVNNSGSIYAHNYANQHDKWYVVYSYGVHFPMYLYDYATNTWYGNWEKARRTTSKHQSQTHPLCEVKYIAGRLIEIMARLGPTEMVNREMQAAAGIKQAA